MGVIALATETNDDETGGFVLDLENPAVKEVFDSELEKRISGLKSKQSELHDDIRKAKAERNELREQLKAASDRLTVTEQAKSEAVTAAHEEAERIRCAAQTEADDFKRVATAEHSRLFREAELQRSLYAVGVLPRMMDIAVNHLGHKIEVKNETDGMRAYLDSEPLAVAVAHWANTEEGKGFVRARMNTGGGFSGQTRPGAIRINPKENPWSREGLNLTKQGQVLKIDPARARMLIVAAGKTPATFGL
tara:strand:+ start:2975 stop:3721 length:747 start_codon:yes stop_codon:yes gene_type:complete